MGKWTPNYLDDVLLAKFSSMVSGSIKRSCLEAAEPPITYETFVRELETGDSFTTSLVDILVKEVADRRTRANVNDRRLIADKTAKNLRMLATPLRIYRDRPSPRNHISRRTVNLTEYLTAPPNQMDVEEDEDDFESMLDDPSAIEGARLNSDLYEAYGTHSWPVVPGQRRFHASPSPVSDDGLTTLPLLRSPPSTSRSGPWSMPPAASSSLSGTGLARQSSIRRPTRSRTVDFNDFTHRRRSSIRDAAVAPHPDSSEPAVDAREPTSSRNPQYTRRFFPFTRTRRHESSGSFPWSDRGDNSADERAVMEVVPYEVVPSSPGPAWFTQAVSSYEPPAHVQESEGSDETVPVSAPRLRRGGLRAPESMLSRHVSPIVFTSLDQAPVSPESENGDANRSSGDAAAYPTPGPTENETVT